MTHAPTKAIVIRPAIDADAPTIDAILREAFGASAEAELVTQLRRDRALVMELVAERSAEINGYIAFPRLRVQMDSRTVDAIGLAPLAVATRSQRQGIGTALVEDGCRRLADDGETIVFVLGGPGYYSRVGFQTEFAARFTSVYAGPYFMARALSDSAPASGTVHYPAAFDVLS
jgi:putative acetyltransferase